MKSNPTYPRDIQILGAETRYQVVRADAADGRDWLKPGRVCPWLGQHQIEHVGIMEASEPFEVVRNDQSGAFMLACLEGEGAVMADGIFLQFARPHTPDARLWRLWQAVEAGIDQPWSLGRMAAIACVSEEHLRRLCRKELGRSPMQHLTHLRLHRAVHLLSTTGDKVEVIARNVGFESVFTFSNTFKKWIGWRPSDHRRCGQS